MASKLSAPAKKLRDFLVEHVKLPKKYATDTVTSIQSKNNFDISQMKDVNEYLQGEFYEGFKTRNQDVVKHKTKMQRYSDVDDIGRTIFARGQRYGDMMQEWNRRGFNRLSYLDSYQKLLDSATRTAMTGKNPNFDRIGHTLQKEDMARFTAEETLRKEAEAKAQEEARIAQEYKDYKKNIMEKNTQEAKANISSFLRNEIGLSETEANGVLNNVDPHQREKFLSTARSIYDGSGTLTAYSLENGGEIGRLTTSGTIDEAIAGFTKPFGDKTVNVFDATPIEGGNVSLRDLILSKGARNRMAAEQAETARSFAPSGMRYRDGKPGEAGLQRIDQKVLSDDQLQSIKEELQTSDKLDDEVNTKKQIAEVEREQAARTARTAPVGSGKTLSEGKQQLLTTNKDGTVSLNEAGYNELADNDPSFWGYKGARQHHIKGVNERIAEYNKSIQGKTPEEIAALRKTFEDKLTEDVKGGYGVSDWIFGNQLHTGAVGAAAIMGTMGVAFGGHRSNADLYSSPF